MSTDSIEISTEEMDALIGRIEEALREGLSLEPADISLILKIIRHFAFMQERLQGNEVMKQRYLKLLGLVGSSETQKQLFDRKRSKPRQRTKKPRQTTPPRTPKVYHHELEGLEKGQLCPACGEGRLYKYEPASFVRIVGQAPLSAERHVMKQLRCALCGELYTAPLPEEVLQDGVRGQSYGYSARAMMALNKFFMGSPYFRQENLQKLLGVTISASSVYDQCAQLAALAEPLQAALRDQAAQAGLFYLDDTGHRILDQQPIEKPNRRGQGTRTRSGVYTSGVIALDGDGHRIVLFQTNIGHAGEWIDEILSARDSALAPPVVMSDALASNTPLIETQQALCNAHARRKFVDVINHFPESVELVLTTYAAIWQHDDESRAQNYTPEQRRDYHAEHSLPVMKMLKQWGESQLSDGEVEANSGLGKAIQYLLNHYQGLSAFCRIPAAPIDNNLMEATLKLIATSRKNSYFYKTLAGAKVGDGLTSLIATCELNGVNAFDYLVAIQRHHHEVSRNPESWLPYRVRDELTTQENQAA